MEKKPQAGPQLPQEDVQAYNKLKQEYAQMFKVFLELEEEKREHTLVFDALKNLEENRRCWRMVGGVLVERNVGEVRPSLQNNIEMLEKTLQSYNDALKKKEKEIMDFELAHGLKSDKAAVTADAGDAKKNTGVLAQFIRDVHEFLQYYACYINKVFLYTKSSFIYRSHGNLSDLNSDHR
eukprot:TRINITY_DN7255_c0_g2_i2.p2 TRINITY_DN7255_c0_g2~~TRINITY_DN7255_c0_g2_i2.p2  ORF type:complete len:180 (+),score=40.34 TRINITY_DN7255_c0_g2_i2:126-665(+)